MGARILDTRFTPEFLAEHPFEKAIADDDGVPRRRREGPGPSRSGASSPSSRPVATTTCGTALARITCPTLVAAGRYDGIAPLANSEAIASRIAGAELRVYEGGHAFFVQDRRRDARPGRLPGRWLTSPTTLREGSDAERPGCA